MPRPSSSTVIDEPSSCSVTRMLRRSRSSPRRWRCRGFPRRGGAVPAEPTPPMYMPGRFRTGSRPFENGDVFRGVVGRGHVYNFAFCHSVGSDAARAVFCSHDCSGISASPCRRAAPVRGRPDHGAGRGARASAGLDPARDRARSCRRWRACSIPSADSKPLGAHGLRAARSPDATAPSACRCRCRRPSGAARSSSRRCRPISWSSRSLSDRRAALLCRGLAGLDDETLTYLAEHPAC